MDIYVHCRRISLSLCIWNACKITLTLGTLSYPTIDKMLIYGLTKLPFQRKTRRRQLNGRETKMESPISRCRQRRRNYHNKTAAAAAAAQRGLRQQEETRLLCCDARRDCMQIIANGMPSSN